MPVPHFIVLGGFLGSGKTTAIRRLGEYLTNQGIRVGLITNDQGNDLVDTQLLRSCGFATQEVAGGCFCCRFDQLMDAARFLTSDVGPEVLVAEAVGSCTDLSATVTYPLRRLFGDSFTVAPLSVMVDPIRARRVMGLDEGEGFSADVEYIYRKQLEEADVIVMNKVDLLPDDSINELGTVLSEAFPRADVMAVSSRDGLQLAEWFHRVLYSVQAPRATVDVDYDIYATGEARLGWVNASLAALGAVPFDGSALLLALARELQAQLGSAGVAHLKMTLAPRDGDASNVASIHVVRNDMEPTQGMQLTGPVTAGRVVVNLRAEAPPNVLERALRVAAERVGGPASAVALTIEIVQAFSPSRPTPTHRDTEVPG
jgi:Ni2+-binding GTPase involved in maturation of urease and hydrogenase